MDGVELSVRQGRESRAPVRCALASCAAALILAACGGGGGGGGGAVLASVSSGAASQGQISTDANGGQSSLATDLNNSPGSSPSGNTTPGESVGPGSNQGPGAFTRYTFKIGPLISYLDPDVARKVFAALATPELKGYEYEPLASPVYVRADPGVEYTYWLGTRSEMNSIDSQTEIVSLASDGTGPVVFRRPVVPESFVYETTLIDIQPVNQLVDRLKAAGAKGFCTLTGKMDGYTIEVQRRIEANPASCDFQEWLTDHPVGDEEALQKISEFGAAGYKRFFNNYYVRDTTQNARYIYEVVDQPPYAKMTAEERVTIYNKMGATGALSYSSMLDQNKTIYRRTLDCTRRWFCGW